MKYFRKAVAILLTVSAMAFVMALTVKSAELVGPGPSLEETLG